MPLFDLEFSKCSYSGALATACGALVFDDWYSFRVSNSSHFHFCLSSQWVFVCRGWGGGGGGGSLNEKFSLVCSL